MIKQTNSNVLYCKQNFKVYNTLCPTNSDYANLGKTNFEVRTILNYITKKEKKRNTIKYRKKQLIFHF